jgi:UPF0716 protein FxsA
MVGLLGLLEIVVFVLMVAWIGVGWTILAMLATSALGAMLLARQGARTLGELRRRARSRQPAARELGDAGLVAVGGLLMVLPGFVGDVIGLLCLLPGTRTLERAVLAKFALSRLPYVPAGPVRVGSTRTAPVGPAGGWGRVEPLVIEGEVVDGDAGGPLPR